MHAFAQAVTDHAVNLNHGRPLHALVESITSILAVSAEVAQHLAMRLGEHDAFPAADPRLLRALSDATGQAVTSQQAQLLAERWRPWRAHAAAQLWLSG